VRNALLAQNAPPYQPLLVSVRYVSQLEAAFADYGAPKAYNDYPVLRPRRRLGVVGLRLYHYMRDSTLTGR
jgi:hypothetical protein